MNDTHLNDFAIQQYVLHESNTDQNTHVKHCASCRIKVKQYEDLFRGIKTQEQPVFNFDLAGAVMAQLPKQSSPVADERVFYYLLAGIVIFAVGVVGYLFGGELLNLFYGLTPSLAGLIIVSSISMFIFLCIDMYRKYQKQMKFLLQH